ncbi:hypothetical protein [Hyphomicrobium denitrificans]|uniref:hypothetical protein n=1 Tax=Hyphomicrobium denitrificans TaxID=53399 RepID=UPI00031EAE40|nr:hypothetical protein [Hyphomicrobium denitrificans]
MPVRHIPGSAYEWTRQAQYGTGREEIADAIVREWQSVPDDPMELVGQCPWFARPDPKFPKYVKMD